jgi:predicted nucleotidyltransferase
MQFSETETAVLTRFRQALSDAYGERLERVVLFGSRARGDAREDSDYDIAVFIYNQGRFWDESGILAHIETDIMLDTGAVINAMPLRAGSYADRTGFMSEIRKDGIDL